MSQENQTRSFLIEDYLRLKDIHEAHIFSQFRYWQNSKWCRYHFEYDNSIWLKIELKTLLEEFPWLAIASLKRKLKSLNSKGALKIYKLRGFNIYQIIEEGIVSNRGYTTWGEIKMISTRDQNDPSYISIIYNNYIYSVADRIFIDRTMITFEQIRKFYYELGKTIADVKCGSKATALVRFKRLSNKQVDNIVDAIILLSKGKWHTLNDDFKQRFKQFESWLSLFLKSDDDFIKEELEEITKSLTNATLSPSAFEFWSTKTNISKEIYYAHQSQASKGFTGKPAKRQEQQLAAVALANLDDEPEYLEFEPEYASLEEL